MGRAAGASVYVGSGDESAFACLVLNRGACPLQREHMQLIIDKREKPTSFTGLSLVLFLFLSMLSMMAAYEAGKPTDDIRGATIASLNEYSPLGADAETETLTLLADSHPSRAPAFQQIEYLPHALVMRVALEERAFNARAPPRAEGPAS